MHVNILHILAILAVLTLKYAYCYYPIFDLYTRTNRDTLFRVNEYNIKNSPYSFTRENYLIIHGWNGGSTNDWVLKIKDNLLAKENVNVFAVDWSEGSSGINYFIQADSVSTCGVRVASFLSKAGIPLSKVHCIGNSLGAHVCGFAGKQGKLARITGMDPAGPGFKGKTAAERLDKSDATYVDIIHTNSFFGIQDPIGHKNFYPNGGESQRGCYQKATVGNKQDEIDYIELFALLINEDNAFQNILRMSNYYFNELYEDVSLFVCSHSRAKYLYAESITTKCKFAATPCGSYDDYNAGRCRCPMVGCPTLGHHSKNVTLYGKFYLKTNGYPPYCIS